MPTAADLCKQKFERDAQEARAAQQQAQYRRMVQEQRRQQQLMGGQVPPHPALPGNLLNPNPGANANGVPNVNGLPVAGPVAAAAAAAALATGGQVPLPNGTQQEGAAPNPNLPAQAPAVGTVPRPISAAANANVVAQLRAQAANGTNLGVNMNGIQNISQHGQQVQRLQQQLGANVPMNLDNAALRRAQMARMGMNAAQIAAAQGRSATPQAGPGVAPGGQMQTNGQVPAGQQGVPPQAVPGVEGATGMRPTFPPNYANMTPEQLQQMRAQMRAHAQAHQRVNIFS